MLGKIFGRKDAGKARKDVAIVHQSVPDEVLNIEPKHPETLDTSWMNATNIVEKPKQAKAPVSPAVVKPVKPRVKAAAPVPPSATANPRAATGVRCPFGWLVVVEGSGVGEWFVLERGVTHIGRDEGQTVCLDFGDESISAHGHAQISYDEARHCFVLDKAGQDGLRVNGVVADRPTALRDGDIVTTGGTGLRLVALCSPNFNWS